MLLPWSKSLALTIAPHSIALTDFDKKVHILSEQETEFAKLGNVLEKSKTALSNQAVDIYLSHHFVRFLVLPWQAHVFKLEDWQAIAKHAFKKEFGNIANAWEVRVDLLGLGQPVVAVAIDQVIINQLTNIAMNVGFNLNKVAPLLNLCWFKKRTENHWLLIVEPQKLLLVQMLSGVCNQLFIDVPPSGLEQTHAIQLVKRSIMQTEEKLRPKRVLAYVSAELPMWQKNADDIIQVIHHHLTHQPHAAWMASLLNAGGQ